MEQLPESLRAGSPVVARGSFSFSDQTSTRTISFPAGADDSTPISPLSPDPAYAPTPPVASRSRGLLSRLGNLRSSRRQSRYGALGDDDDREALNPSRPPQLRDLDEEEDEEGIGFDVSAFEGPIQMKHMDKKDAKIRINEVEDEEDIDSSYAGLANEFYRLEVEDRGRGALGSGMGMVLKAPSHHQENASREGEIRGIKNKVKRSLTHKDAQKAAEKTGEIVAVSGECVYRYTLSPIMSKENTLFSTSH